LEETPIQGAAGAIVWLVFMTPVGTGKVTFNPNQK